MKLKRLAVIWILLFAAEFSSPHSPLAAQTPGSIDDLLRSINKVAPGELPVDEGVALTKAVDVFAARRETMDAQNVASSWLQLYDRYMAVKNDDTRYYDIGTALPRVLPPPEAYTSLKTLVEARPLPENKNQIHERALRALVALLGNNWEQAQSELALAESAAEKYLDRSWRDWELGQIRRLHSRIESKAKHLNDDAGALEVEEALAATADRPQTGFYLPDLVIQQNRTIAEQLILRILKNPHVFITGVNGKETKLLAQTLTLAHFREIKNAPWGLVHKEEDLGFFDKLRSLYPSQSPPKDTLTTSSTRGAHTYSDSYSGLANGYYAALWLKVAKYLRSGEHNKASQLMKTMPEDQWGTCSVLVNAWRGFSPSDLVLYSAVQSFMANQLRLNPSIHSAYCYLELAKVTGNSTTEELEIIEKLWHETSSKDKKLNIHSVRNNSSLNYSSLLQAYLQGNHLAKAVTVIRHAAEVANKETSEQRTRFTPQDRKDPASYGIELIHLGDALGDDSLSQSGHRMVVEFWPIKEDGNRQPTPVPGFTPSPLALFANDLTSKEESTVAAYVKILMKHNRAFEAEQKLQAWLKNAALRLRAQPDEYTAQHEANRASELLLGVLVKEKKFSEAKKLLDVSPFWAKADAAALVQASYGYAELATSIAATLVQTGQPQPARALLDTVIQQNPKNLQAYSVYLDAVGLADEDKLEELSALYPLHVEPLLWRAKLLRSRGKIELATTLAKQAQDLGAFAYTDEVEFFEFAAELFKSLQFEKEAAQLNSRAQAAKAFARARVLFTYNYWTKAIERLNEAQAADPSWHLPKLALAIAHERSGNIAQAQASLEQALTALLSTAWILPPFGLCIDPCICSSDAIPLRSLQHVRQHGIAFLQRLAASGQRPVRLSYLTGQLLDYDAAITEAAQAFRDALTLNPKFISADFALAGLKGSHCALDGCTNSSIDLDDKLISKVLDQYLYTPGSSCYSRGYNSALEATHDIKHLWEISDTWSKRQPILPRSLYPLTASAAELTKRSLPRWQVEPEVAGYGDGPRYVHSYTDSPLLQAQVLRDLFELVFPRN